ncbi:hypothetical protein [Paenibacillus sp. MBLB4367]|uniref:hypothetical protein n=1 Tax=Paenibacillus sp. MBLB4367 TaxID=3384767 RepID=UPI00390836D4
MATMQVHFFSKSMRREVTFNALIPMDRPEIPGMPPVEAQPIKALYLLNGYSGSYSDWITFSRIRELFWNASIGQALHWALGDKRSV